MTHFSNTGMSKKNSITFAGVGLTALHPYGHLSHPRVFIPRAIMKQVGWSVQM